MSVRILHGDMREKLAEVEDASIDAVITDPPYHLTTSKKGGSGPASVNLESPYGRARIGTGFMGMKWDGGDIAMRPETWAALLRVAKPGAHLVAFSSSRTFHRMWCAVEDAGWEIRDTLMWLHGEGFPKSSNQHGEWEGWGTALKPAFEPIVLARKPLVGTVAANLEAHRVGALNINASRVPVTDGAEYARNFSGDRGHEGTRDLAGGTATNMRMGGGTKRKPRADGSVFHRNGTGMANENNTVAEADPRGRWPANVLHDGSEEVVAAFPSEAGDAAPVHRRGSDKFRSTYGAFAGNVDERGSTFHGDSGSAARFFWSPKASRSDRDAGLEWLEPKREADRVKTDGAGGDNPRNRSNHPRSNHHPTVKPTALMQYLCRLVTPRGGIVLDPFMGSGSTGKAAMREGFSFVGIELDEQYIEIAKRRIHSDAPLFAEVA